MYLPIHTFLYYNILCTCVNILYIVYNLCKNLNISLFVIQEYRLVLKNKPSYTYFQGVCSKMINISIVNSLKSHRGLWQRTTFKCYSLHVYPPTTTSDVDSRREVKKRRGLVNYIIIRILCKHTFTQSSYHRWC